MIFSFQFVEPFFEITDYGCIYDDLFIHWHIITTHIFEISRSHIDLFSNYTEESFYIMFKNRILES